LSGQVLFLCDFFSAWLVLTVVLAGHLDCELPDGLYYDRNEVRSQIIRKELGESVNSQRSYKYQLDPINNGKSYEST